MTMTCKYFKSAILKSKEISSALLLRMSLPILGRQNLAHHEKDLCKILIIQSQLKTRWRALYQIGFIPTGTSTDPSFKPNSYNYSLLSHRLGSLLSKKAESCLFCYCSHISYHRCYELNRADRDELGWSKMLNYFALGRNISFYSFCENTHP